VLHPVLGFVQQHHYIDLYNYEKEGRNAYQYPPYYRLLKLTFKQKDSYVAEEAANILLNGLQVNFKQYLNGPSQPPVDRVRNQYLWEILVKLPKDTSTINRCKREIQQQIAIIHGDKKYRTVSIVIDVDPV
jgi:primosomal protein N' (replication factor Y)